MLQYFLNSNILEDGGATQLVATAKELYKKSSVSYYKTRGYVKFSYIPDCMCIIAFL